MQHPNVASVFHLGKAGRSYFYAMEFVEGEPLNNLIKRLGRLEVNLALEITRQVGSGLAALHKQDLVHRDIKPSNIMVNLEEADAPTIKIIDLMVGSIPMTPCWLALKAEALHCADRSSEAAEAIIEAQALAQRSGERWWYAELHRLRGVFPASIGADEMQIEASFCAAIRIAKEQKSISAAGAGGSNLC